MTYRMGWMKQFLAAGLLAVIFLSGCNSAPAASSVDLVPPEEEAQEETAAQQLEQQLIAMINLGQKEENQISSDPALEQTASFFLEYVLQDPGSYLDENHSPSAVETFLTGKDTYTLVYDGSLSAAQVGEKVLLALQEMEKTFSQQGFTYKVLKSIAVEYGEGDRGPAWVILVFYPTDRSSTP